MTSQNLGGGALPDPADDEETPAKPNENQLDGMADAFELGAPSGLSKMATPDGITVGVLKDAKRDRSPTDGIPLNQ